MSNGINVNCQNCGKLFEIDYADADETGRAGAEYLCPGCRAETAPEEPKRRFEYCIVPYITNGEPKGGSLNDYGAEGWQLVAVVRGRFIFMREYFE